MSERIGQFWTIAHGTASPMVQSSKDKLLMPDLDIFGSRICIQTQKADRTTATQTNKQKTKTNEKKTKRLEIRKNKEVGIKNLFVPQSINEDKAIGNPTWKETA